MTGYRCQADMGGPDVQRNVDPGWLLAPHNDPGEFLTLFYLELRFAEISGKLAVDDGMMILQAYESGTRAAGSTNSLSSARDEQCFSVDVHPP